ncbi:hypothetical protein [Mumia sp.]|uniref:hypothetical protein n=1 Tax=Mumia sp. TaxID=1965300 RepID=UPI00261D89DA|nr:hypothetical protein [Mumia sp.]MDD9349778.1 hypothetical protein [Mumia sp.]
MTRRWMRIGVAAAGSVLAVGLIPGTAHAATTDVKDPRGDAPRVADITKLRVKNGEHRVTGVLTVPHHKKRKYAGIDLMIRTKDSGRWAYIVSIAPAGNGQAAKKGLFYQRGDDPATSRRLPCTGIKTAWKSKKITISVPVRCLTETSARRVRARAGIITRLEPGHDWYDDLTRYSRYVRRG